MAARVPPPAAVPALPVLVLPLLLVLLGISTGCTARGSTDGGARRPAAPSRSSGPSASDAGARPTGGLDKRRLRTALLDLADFPTGWAADSPRSARKRDRGVPEPKDADCRALFSGAPGDRRGSADAADAVRARAQATAGFLRSRYGPFLATVAASYRGAADARAALAAFERAGRGCRSFQVTEEGQTVRYAAAPLEVPDLGDGSRAVRFRQQGEEASVEAVLARVGANLVLVARAGREELNTADAEDIEALAKRAVAKLRAVADGRTPVPDGSHPGATDL